MPVRFEGKSEYDRNYKWRESFKSRSFQPTTAQMMPAAGSSSAQLGSAIEPPIQQKKRPVSTTEVVSKSLDHEGKEVEPPLQRKKRTPPSATSLAFYDDEVQQAKSDNEYMLLGSQSKFAHNVVYKSKHRDLAKTKKLSQNEANGIDSPPPAPREKPAPPPPPRVRVDTGAPKQQPKKKADPPIREAPRPPVKSKSAPAVSAMVRYENRDPHQPPPLPPKPVHQHRHDAQPKRKEPERRSREAEDKAGKQKAAQDRWARRAGRLNEFAQTDLDKGVAESGQEAGADYALKYQSGVAPPRPRGPKRLSEYQMEFEWKKRVAASPLIAAEQVVYNSNPQVAPYKAESFVKNSEYKSQFKPWSVAASVPVAPLAATAGVPVAEGRKHRHKQHKKPKMQRSRSLEDLTPDKRPPAGSRHDITESDKRLVKESLNPQKLHFPHGKLKKYKSEYEMNFQAPSMYHYEDGAWKGADPPHLKSNKDTEAVAEPAEQLPLTSPSSWFQEVRELRDKAQEYKQRAQGTHFSRQHLAQLYAQQAELWDTASNSSVLSALSLEVNDPTEHRKSSKRNQKPRPVRKSAWTAQHDGDDQLSQCSSARDSMLSTPVASSGRQSYSSRASSVSSVSSRASTLVPDEDESNEGRIPTPKMRQGNWANRHHLDRTTPAVGGALLTSPPRPLGSPYSVETPFEEAESPVTQVTRSEVTQSGHHKKSSKKQHSRHDSNVSQTSSRGPKQSTSAPGMMERTEPYRGGPTPTFGMPTQDSHPLLDEEASTDRPLHTHYVNSPPQDKSASRRVAREKFPQVEVPSTIDEDGGATYNELRHGTKMKSSWVQVGLDDIPQRDLEDDLLSVSARSVASSCSLASEVLDRARHRRDEFWGHHEGLA